MQEREHPEDDPVLKCQACSRVVGPRREHEEPVRSAFRLYMPETRHATAMAYKEGCRCKPCTDAYKKALYKQAQRDKAKRAVA